MSGNIKNKCHNEILDLIRKNSGKPTQHTFLNNYLGNEHMRYPISAPVLRTIAKDWMRNHKLNVHQFSDLLTSLIQGESSTEKCMAGIMLDYSTKEQRQFDPALFDRWLDDLIGWAEVDSVCTSKYTVTAITSDWKAWKKLLTQFSKSENIHKRRASLVILCAPLRTSYDERLSDLAFQNIKRLKDQPEVLITKAISWVLRSMTRHYRKQLEAYIRENRDTLPKIAVRETLMKLETGRKTTKKHSAG